ncbi:hypothetical protein IJ384_03915 [bacterium]|nr:hypothetical protein [bacterium]
MRKLLLLLCFFIISSTSVFAAKIPENVQEYILKNIPNTDIRFDGVIILPDNTIYLPLFPSLFSDINKLAVKESFPANKELSDKPDIIIFNNDFVLMKVYTDGKGRKTVRRLANPPLQIRTGLLPQDMLVPSGLFLPENIKGVIGNLKIDTKNEDIIKQNVLESYEVFLAGSEEIENPELIPELKNKTLFVTTNYSKNIQVLDPPEVAPKYSLAQKSIPIDLKSVNDGKFLLVTAYERPFVDVISVADSRFIKQINLGSLPEEILLDEANNRAYITSPKASIIYVIDLKTMSLIQKIRINGHCEKLILAEQKMFYVDKLKNDVWAIELNNDYLLKNLGRFPNISSIAVKDNLVYLASRTKSRIAVLDYSTLGLVSEFTTVNKPIAMQIWGDYIYILGAQNNVLQKLNILNGKIIGEIELATGGFSVGFNKIEGTNLAIVTDIKQNKYSVVDLAKGMVLKTYAMTVPINKVVIANKVKLFE